MNGTVKHQLVEKVAQKLQRQKVTQSHSRKKAQSHSKTRPPVEPSAAQRREQVGAKLAVMLVASFGLLWLALVMMALVRADTSNDLIDIAGRVLPILVALLTPILHHYFGRGRNDKDA